MCLESSTDKSQDGNRAVQWDMIKYLISEVLYGGRVTDEMDRRLLNVYANQFFNEKVIGEEKYVLSDPNLPYCIPDEVPNKDQK
jgi:dynein heavy chain